MGSSPASDGNPDFTLAPGNRGIGCGMGVKFPDGFFVGRRRFPACSKHSYYNRVGGTQDMRCRAPAILFQPQGNPHSDAVGEPASGPN